MIAQPYTKDDLKRGEDVVKRLHGVTGFDAWAEVIAKELAAARDRGIEVGTALANTYRVYG